MALTFETLIRHNKRTSNCLVLGMVVFTALVAGVFGLALTGTTNTAMLPVFLISSAIGAGVASFGAIISFYFGANIVAGISGAKAIERHEDTVLFNVVEEIAIAAGVPPPKIYVMYDESPNAFASGRDPKHAIVAITTGLRKKLSRDELQAVIAHEMAHIKNYDIRLMMLVGVFAGMVVIMSDLFMRMAGHSFRFGGGRREGSSSSSSSSKNSNANVAIFAVVIVGAIVLALIAPVISKLLQLAVSREREYLADATAVRLCRNPAALASALKKIAFAEDKLDFPHKAMDHMFIINPDPKRRFLRADKDSIWSTHPPLLKRIAKLDGMVSNEIKLEQHEAQQQTAQEEPQNT